AGDFIVLAGLLSVVSFMSSVAQKIAQKILVGAIPVQKSAPAADARPMAPPRGCRAASRPARCRRNAASASGSAAWKSALRGLVACPSDLAERAATTGAVTVV